MNETIQVTYIYGKAFFDCDCGNQVILSHIIYGDERYTGSCPCGKEYQLLDGTIREPEPQTP